MHHKDDTALELDKLATELNNNSLISDKIITIVNMVNMNSLKKLFRLPMWLVHNHQKHMLIHLYTLLKW